MHQQRVQGAGFTRQQRRRGGVEQVRQFGFGLGLVHGGVRGRIDDDIRAQGTHAARHALRVAEIRGMRTLAAQGDDFPQHRQAALQLPADLARRAQKNDFHALAYWVCTQSR
ncbi:hypothetical protein D3C85_1506950 [compost metagenome]